MHCIINKCFWYLIDKNVHIETAVLCFHTSAFIHMVTSNTVCSKLCRDECGTKKQNGTSG